MVPYILLDLVPLFLVGPGPSTDSGTKICNMYGEFIILYILLMWSLYFLKGHVLQLTVGLMFTIWRIYGS